MARYLMTHSLLSSWLYAIKDNPYEDATTERDTMKEFMTNLRREPTPTTEAMQKGIDFEHLVMNIVDGIETIRSSGDDAPQPISEHRWYSAAEKVAHRVRGGIPQYKARRMVEAGGLTLVLYGRLDWLKAGEIIDTKFSSHYDRGKYIDSTQHPTYFELVPEARKFSYIVSNGMDVWTETYFREDTPSIFPVISDFLDWLAVMGLLELYKEKWVAL